MTQQNLCDTAKAVVRRRLVALNAWIRKEERFPISDLNFHPGKVEKEEQTEPEAKK